MIWAMRQTIKQHKDFLMADNDIVAKSQFFLIRARPTRFSDGARYGLITTKRTFKLAVHRNRARRLLRTWIRKCDHLFMPDMDYIFLARPSILNATLPDGVTAMTKALRYLRSPDAQNAPK